MAGNITLDADGGTITFSDNGSGLGTITSAGFTGNVDATTLKINNTLVTSTAAELNILDGVTATATELNILDGVTAAAELNILDGVTAAAQN